jgi:DNA-binding MarR family transcriptional regulator
LGVNQKNVTPHITSLEKRRLIRTHMVKARRYFLVLDPRIALDHMVQTGEIG